MSAQKTIQWSDTKIRELLERLKESSVFFVMGSLICHPGKSMIKKTEEEEKLMTTPAMEGEMYPAPA